MGLSCRADLESGEVSAIRSQSHAESGRRVSWEQTGHLVTPQGQGREAKVTQGHISGTHSKETTLAPQRSLREDLGDSLN